MPAKSEKQRKFMGAVMAFKMGELKDAPQNIKAAAAGMTKKQVMDFLKENQFFDVIDEKYVDELSNVYCDVKEGSDHLKYGRYKLFNIDAMKEVVSKSNFLTNQYEKMKVRGKEIFGYHYNEIILSFIFIKYIKNDEKMYAKYMETRNRSIKTKEKEDLAKEKNQESDVNETTTSGGVFGTGGIPSTPSFLAKGNKNWRNSKNTGIEGSKVVKSKNDFVSKDLVNEFNKLIDGDLIIESITNENEIQINDYHIDNMDIVVEYFIGDGDLQEYKIDIDDYYDFISPRYDTKVDADYVVDNLETNDLKEYIKTNMNKTKFNEVENKIDEHHIESRDEITTFILNNCEKYTEKELNDMSYDDLYKTYISVENDTEFSDNNKEVILGGNKIMEQDIKQKIEDIKMAIRNEEKKEKPNNDLLQTLRSDLRKYEAGKLDEAEKPSALTMLDRIKKENEKNEDEYFKTLNKGVQDGMKNPDMESTFTYDYDKDSVKKEDIPAYRDSNAVDTFVDMNRGRQLYDIDFDIKPTKEYLDRLKQNIGEENFKKMVKKAELRRKEKRYMRDVETVINPNDEKDMIKLNETVITGYYTDKYNSKKFLNLKISNISKVDAVNESMVPFRFDGLGNYYSSLTDHGNIETINESKEFITKHEFYYNTKDKSVVYVDNSSTKKVLDESYKKEFYKTINYKSSDFYNPKNKKDII